MFIGELAQTERGKPFLIVTKDVPAAMIESGNFRTIGLEVHPEIKSLDYRVIPERGVVEVGYREDLISHGDGFERVEYRLETRMYLHSEPGNEAKGKVVAAAPLMSIAHMLGASEIHGLKFEDSDYVSFLKEQGIEFMVIEKPEEKKAEATKTTEPEAKKPVESKKPEEKQPVAKKSVRSYFGKKKQR